MATVTGVVREKPQKNSFIVGAMDLEPTQTIPVASATGREMGMWTQQLNKTAKEASSNMPSASRFH